MDDTELCYTGAKKLARMIRARKVSAIEVMRAFIAQIERVNPKVNAIVTFLPEQALKAREIRRIDPRTRQRAGPLAGLPIAHKDIVPHEGHPHHLRLADLRATTCRPRTTLIVERLRAAGAITARQDQHAGIRRRHRRPSTRCSARRAIPRTSTRPAAARRGGAAVAVACGMLPFADGSDLGGIAAQPGQLLQRRGLSARRRAACRTGRVPNAWDTLSVLGPIARTVEDAALLFSAMAGPDPRAPISHRRAGQRVRAAARARLPQGARGLERATSAGCRWIRASRAVLEAQRDVLESLGCIVEEARARL